MDMYYINHLNEKFLLDSENVILKYQELFNYSWDADTDNGKITSFTREMATYPITVTVTADSDEEFADILNNFHSIVVKDIIDHTPGRLYIGDQYLSCYISGDIKTDAFMGVPIQVKNLTVVTDHPFWITDKKYEFKKGVEGKGVGYLDFPFDTPFDLMGDEKGTGSITIEHYAACDFLLTIYGPCLNPRIVIGDNLYEVRTKLDGGEYLLIDSREGTVFRVRTNGTKVNEFDNRVTSPNSPFEKIQPRYNLVSWDGSFGFDLLLFIERSEPKCAQKR